VGLTRGDSANDLFPFVIDPNVYIPESKVITVDVRPGRRDRDRDVSLPGATELAPGRDLPHVEPPSRETLWEKE
jgi:formate dehydrogenase major subunit